jgi:hypothetical protein
MSSSDRSQARAGTQTQTASALATCVIARAQDLVDSRPAPGEAAYHLDWCQEALNFGDLTAIAAILLTRAATTPARANPREFR